MRRSITFKETLETLIEDYRRSRTPIPSFNKAVCEILMEALMKRKLGNGVKEG